MDIPNNCVQLSIVQSLAVKKNYKVESLECFEWMKKEWMERAAGKVKMGKDRGDRHAHTHTHIYIDGQSRLL